MNSRRDFLAGAGAISAGIALPRAASAYAPQPISGTVTVAVIGPFTGPDQRAGEQMANGVRAATDDANRLRGPLDRAYAMRTFDDQNLVALGLQSAEFACDDQSISAVVGHLDGKVTEIALDTYAKNGMPLVCPAATFDRLTQHGYSDVLRLATKDSVEGQLAAKYVIKAATPKSVAVLVQDGDYGVDVAAGFGDELDSNKIAIKDVIFSWEKPNFDDVVKKTMELKPDAIYLAGIPKDMGPALPALRAAGYTGPFFASQGFFDPLTLQKYGKAAEGIVVSTSMPPLQLAPGAFRIRNDYEQRYGPMTPLAAFSYAAAQIVIATVRRTNAIDRVGVLRALSTQPVYDTVVGEFDFTSTGDPANPQAYFYGIRDGAWKYVGSALPSSFVVK